MIGSGSLLLENSRGLTDSVVTVAEHGARCSVASRRDHSVAMATVSLLLLALVATPTLATPFAMRSHHLAINQGLEGRNIRNLECISRKTQEKGTCMFALTCLKLNGTHLGVCVDRFYYGSCCRLPENHVLDVGNVETNVISSAPGGPFVKPNKPPVTAASVVEEDGSTTSRPAVIATTKRTPTTASKPSSPQSGTQKPTTPVRKPSTTTKRPEVPPKPVTTKPIAETTTQKQPTTTPKPVAVTTASKPVPTKRPTSKPTTAAATSKPPAGTTPTKRPVTSKPSTVAKPSNTTSQPGTTKPPAKPAVTTTKPQEATTGKPATSTARPATTTKPTLKPSPPKPVSVPSSTQKPPTTVTQKPVVTTISNEVVPSIRPTQAPILEAVEEETNVVGSTATKPSTSRPAVSTAKPTPSTAKPIPITDKPLPPSGTKPTARPTPPTFPRPPTTTEKPPATPTAAPATTAAPTTAAQTTTVTTAATTVAPPSSPSVTDGEWVQIALSTTPGAVSGATPTTPAPGSIFTEEIPTSGPASPPTFPPAAASTTEASLDLSLNMSDYKQVCGRRLFPESRIVGGTRTTFGKWPWQISLRQWRTSTYLHKCGAALLNENWAITAAHCVENVPPSDLLLRLGEHDLSTESEPYAHLERRVQIVASHPQFDSRTFEYDLALLRFYEPVDFKPNVVPICIPDNDKNFVGEDAYVTGWGRLYEDGPLPSVMQQVSVPVIENAMCETMYRSAGYIEHIPNIFICAGWKKGGFDSCEGDSGGPMVIQREDKRWVLAGVISWGIGCAEPNQPGVYTRISEFRDWINQILQF